jgi:phosphopantothenoylcysteine decarboxylase/phosphopantothenate--cysteine ligase
MLREVLAMAGKTDVVIKAAAVADYRPATRAGQKIKKKDGEESMALVRTSDILAELGKMKRPGQTLVGFAAETENLQKNASAKLEAKNLDLIVANDVTAKGAGFNVATNIVRFIYRDGRSEELPILPKENVAEELLNRVAALRSPA